MDTLSWHGTYLSTETTLPLKVAQSFNL